VYKIRYHMVLCVKYRKWLIRGDAESFVCEVLKGIGERYEFQLDALGCDGNHVHVFIGAAPRNAPSRVMQVMCRCCDMPEGKSVSARMLCERFPELRKTLWGAEFWSDGGYIGTVGDGVTEEIIRKYVEQQGSPEEKEDYAQMKLIKFTS
jgi:putative transposase